MDIELKSFLEKIKDKSYTYPEYPGIVLICYAFSDEKPILLIWDKKEKERVYEDLLFFFKDVHLFYDEKEVSALIESKKFDVLVVSEEDIYKDIQEIEKIEIGKDSKINYEKLLRFLTENSFERKERVFQKGDFSLRGFIIDIFPYERDLPVRLELDNDIVVSLREFDIFTNRSKKEIEKISIFGIKKEKVQFIEKINDFFVISKEIEGIKPDITISPEGSNFPVLPAPNFNRDLNLLRRFLKEKEGYDVNVILESQGEIERMKEILDGSDINFRLGHLSRGFVIEDINKIYITESDIFGFTRIRYEKIELPDYDIEDFNEGDFVVHEDFGIGVFEGLMKEKLHNITIEFLKVRFGRNDEVLVPIDKIYLIKKYLGKEKPDVKPLSKEKWEKKKEKTKEKLKDIAKEMLNLYAKRKASKGFKFSEDTIEQKEMEALFPYDETEDQIKAIREIKNDMEKETPMDRLLCGEVGYGKTEVALRAAFKACLDGKQVAILTPTTILAEQHYMTFKNRLERYPVVVELLSRFTKKREKEIIEGIKEGKVDIVIGTHRILSKDVQFKDLGLLIVDEEQRFGVRQKDKIKHLKENIDFLSMSATPIPRTMNMALYGLMDLSIIETPPPGRMSVITEVIRWDDEIIKDVIIREIERGGQVFFVHNRIETIERVKKKLSSILPDLNIAVAHGRMDSRKLENIMLDFIHKKYDILLSTAIIESGLDIPNVNTIIINDAHMFGLSDLHQLRGRVGRSLRRGFCYLVIPKWLTDTALKRISAIKNYSYLGAGFKIALLDLEIRGAGTLLGLKQHGFIEDVGYDMYMRLLEDAIKEIKGEKGKKGITTEIILKRPLFIPFGYISNDEERIKIYRKIFSVKNENEIVELKKYLEDVYGKMPEDMERIFKWLFIKINCERKNISKIEELKDGYTLTIEGKLDKEKIREIVKKIKIKGFNIKEKIEVILERKEDIMKFIEFL